MDRSLQKCELNRVVLFSLSSIVAEQQSNQTKEPYRVQTYPEPCEWKKGVVVVPVQTSVEDLKRTHRLVGDGFYVNHRIYVEKMPENYTTEPIKTKRTGGYDVETSNLLHFLSPPTTYIDDFY